MIGKPVAIIRLRARRTRRVALVLHPLVCHIRARWPPLDILVRGDSHYAQSEAMACCERKRVGHIYGELGINDG